MAMSIQVFAEAIDSVAFAVRGFSSPDALAVLEAATAIVRKEIERPEGDQAPPMEHRATPSTRSAPADSVPLVGLNGLRPKDKGKISALAGTLRVIKKIGGKCSAVQVARDLCVSPTAAHVRFSNLKRQGLIEMSTEKHVYQITARGEALLLQADALKKK